MNLPSWRVKMVQYIWIIIYTYGRCCRWRNFKKVLKAILPCMYSSMKDLCSRLFCRVCKYCWCKPAVKGLPKWNACVRDNNGYTNWWYWGEVIVEFNQRYYGIFKFGVAHMDHYALFRTINCELCGESSIMSYDS